MKNRRRNERFFIKNFNNKKGELKKPARSIPVGTMSAVIFVFTLYFTENLLLAASCDQ